jgi:hypothetical protein
VKIIQSKYGMNIFRPKYWSENIQTKLLASKPSHQNYGMNIFRPKYWRENIQTILLA